MRVFYRYFSLKEKIDIFLKTRVGLCKKKIPFGKFEFD